MLVLSRKSQQSVVVGGAAGFERLLRVTVLEISGRTVRLGFDVTRKCRSTVVKCGNESKSRTRENNDG